MKNLQEDISKLKRLMNLNEYSKVVDTYDNVDFLDGAVGSSKPSQDSINPNLLKDIDAAAKKAGVKVSVTTAISGHVSLPSRHPSGNAVDIAIINGKAVRKSNREDADKFVDALVSMGYTKNKEVGSKKAVLTFGFPKHDDHVHVSNTTDSPTEETDKKIGELDSLVDLAKLGIDKISKLFSKSKYADKGELFSDIFGLTESSYPSFGNSTKENNSDIIIPKSSNSKIKSPVSGIITHSIGGYRNSITIKHESEGETRFLEFTNIENPKVSIGDKVYSGKELGEPIDDVKVSLYDKRKDKINLNKPIKEKKEKIKVDKEKKSNYSYKKPTSSKLSKYAKPERNFDKKSKYSSKSAETLLNLPSAIMSLLSDKKVNEDIEKIKRLLK